MEKEILELGQFQEVVQLYGFDLLLSLAMLVAGLIVVKLFISTSKSSFENSSPRSPRSPLWPISLPS